jgi:helix-turn-helix protein
MRTKHKIPPYLFPPKLVADRWGRCTKTIQRLISSGALPSVQVGGRRLVPLDAIVAAEKNGVGGRKPLRGSSLADAPQAERASA